MKVSMVLASAHHGGLEKHVRELSHQLVIEGHHVAVIAPIEFLKTLNHTVEKLPINTNRSRYNPLMLLELLLRLNAANGDIIHAQANKAATMVGLLKIFLKTPIVATLHSIKSSTRAFSAFEHIICVSQQLAESFENKQITVIYNGIHPPVFKKIDLRKTFALPESYPVICAVGRLVKAKGFDVLIEAVNGLALSLIIAGEGKDQKKLQQQVGKLDAITCCQLIGHREDVNDLIYSADALVISSRREGFSYVFNEAVLCQANVLSTNVPVANEVLPAELIVPINDVQALRAKLIEHLAQMEHWKNLMLPVQTFVSRHMQCTSMTQHTAQLYQEILNKNQARKAISH